MIILGRFALTERHNDTMKACSERNNRGRGIKSITITYCSLPLFLFIKLSVSLCVMIRVLTCIHLEIVSKKNFSIGHFFPLRSLASRYRRYPRYRLSTALRHTSFQPRASTYYWNCQLIYGLLLFATFNKYVCLCYHSKFNHTRSKIRETRRFLKQLKQLERFDRFWNIVIDFILEIVKDQCCLS